MAKTAYVVNAPTAVLGHNPGETFEAELDPVQEARLIESGALKTVTPKGEKSAEKAKPDPVETPAE